MFTSKPIISNSLARILKRTLSKTDQSVFSVRSVATTPKKWSWGRKSTSNNPPVPLKKSTTHVWQGKTFVDEFEWLRSFDKQTKQYLKEETEYADKLTQDTQQIQRALYQEMKQRLQDDECTIPEQFGAYYYYRRYPANENFPVFCRKHLSLEAAEEIVLDQNALVEPGEYIGIDMMKLSHDHRHLAFTMDKTGSETYNLYIKDLRTGVIDNVIQNVMNMEWAESGEWLYYTVPDHLKRTYRVMRHVLGTPAHSDQLVFEELDERFFVDIVSTKDKKFVTININSKTTSEVRLLNTSRDQLTAPIIIPRTEGIEHYIEHYRGKFLIITNEGGAFNYKVMLVDCDRIADRSQWQCVIPHRPNVKIGDCDVFDEFIVLYERQDGLPQIRVIDVAAVSAQQDYAHLFSDKYHHLVGPLPHPIGHIEPGVNMDTFTRVLRFSYSNPLLPDKTYDYDMRTHRLTCLREKTILGQPRIDTSQYSVERETVLSSDQTAVPITLIRHKDLPRDSNNPVLVLVYGAYGHSLDPSYRDELLPLLSRRWLVVLAHVRGGGDLGGQWYAAGRGLRKVSTMLDFQAVVQHLQREGWTRDTLTVAQCASAGGLVLGWMANQQPCPVHAMVMRVPFLDVLTTMHDTSLPLTVHEYDEWGNPQLSDVFACQLQYDPYQNITRKAYPHLFLTASTVDNRVPYWHPAKYVAKLRHHKTNDNLLLLKTDDTSGHFGEGGRYGRLRECALEYAFYYKALGLPFDSKK